MWRRAYQIWLSRRCSCAFVVCLFLATRVFALDPQKAMTQFTHRSWGAAEGIDQVRSVTQSADGYIWIISGFKLYRYDGFRCSIWEPADGQPGIPSRAERAFASRDGSVWVSYANSVMRIHGGHSTIYDPTTGMTAGHVVAFREDPQGAIWVGGYHGICKFVGGEWIEFGSRLGLPEETIRAILIDHANNVWVSSEDQNHPLPGLMACLCPGEKRFRFGATRIATGQDLAEGPDGRIWAAQTGRSVRPWVVDQTGVHALSPEIRVGSQAILWDRDKSLWVATLGDGLCRVRETTKLGTNDLVAESEGLDRFTQKDGLSSDIVRCLFEDREGVIWVGTSSGLDSFSETKIASYSVREGLPFDVNLVLRATPDGSVWAASDPKGYTELIGRQNQLPNDPPPAIAYSNAPYKPPYITYYLYAEPSGTLLAGTDLGIVQLGGAALGFSMLPDLTEVTTITGDSQGGLWFTPRNRGIRRLFNDQMRQILEKPLVSGDYVLSSLCDKTGGVWFGYHSGLVECYKEGRMRHYYAKDGIIEQEVRGILCDAKGQVWIVGGEGVGRFHDERFQILTAKEGLPGRDYYAMLEDDDGFFWLGGGNEIFRIAPADLEKRLAPAPPPLPFEAFGVDDGLRGFVRQAAHGYPGFGYPIATKSADGRLWFSTSKGLAVIDPKHIPRNLVPPLVHIQQIISDGKILPKAKDPSVAKWPRNLELDYIGLSFVNPARVRYQYELEGHDREWIDAGPRRQAFYSSLKPGKYEFRVRACNNDGVWSDAGDKLDFFIMPAFYERAWFRPLCLLAAALAIWGLYRMRIARITDRLRLQMEAQDKERRRIAQELHDTLLQGFIGIGLKLDAVANELPDSLASLRERLRTILLQSEKYLNEARRSVWQLRSASLEESEDLSKAVSDSSRRLLEGTGIQWNFSVDGVERRLALIVEDNLLRICEEAIVNAVKHANPTQVQVNFEFNAKQVRVRIWDDGCGFNPQGTEGSKAGHFGLIGIQERVRSISGHLSLNSQPGKGTEIIVTVHV
jgi:ligand-binding sensor domain-containing protein/two-component sensor histidine kinase